MKKYKTYDKLDKLIVNLYEVQLVFKSGEVYTLHLDDIKRGMRAALPLALIPLFLPV